jgi:hypothetical protein
MMTTMGAPIQKLITNLYLPCHHASSVKLSIPKGESVQIDGEDRTQEFSGKTIEIEHVRKVKLLVLEEV